MATKTNNLGLSKAELTDAVKSTLIANNGNFDKIDDANYSLEKQTERLRANQISDTASGFEIELESDLEMESVLQISGNSEQETRSGKNLFDSSLFDNLTVQGIKLTQNNDGTLNLNGTANATWFEAKANINLPVGTYIFNTSMENKNGSPHFKIWLHDAEGNLVVSTGDGNTFTTTVEMKKISLIVENMTANTTYNLQNVAIQLEKGSTATPYEPYGAMPSPEFPSEIRSIKSKSDNLLDATKQPARTSGAKVTTVLETGARVVNTYAGDACWVRYVIGDISQHIGKTVRVKCNFSASGTNTPRFVAGICNSDGTNAKQLSTGGTISGQEISFNVPELVSPQTYLFLSLYSNLGAVGTIGDYADFTNIMVTIDSEIKNYQPYGTPSEAVNLFDETEVKKGYYLSKDNVLVASNYTNMSGYIPVKGNATYTFSYDYTTLSHEGARDCFFLDYDKKILVSFPIYVTDADKKLTIKPSRDGYLVICYDKNFTNMKLTKEVRGYVPVEAKVEGKNIAKINEADWNLIDNSIVNKARNSGFVLTTISLKSGQTLTTKLKMISKPTTSTTFTFHKNGTDTGSNYSFQDFQNYNLGIVYSRSYTAIEDCEVEFIQWGNANSDIYEFQFWATVDNDVLEEYEPYEEPTTIRLPLGDIELNEMDGVRDTFCKVNGTWNKVNRMFKHSFTKNDGCYLDNTKSTDKKRLRFLVDPVAISTGASEIKPILSNIGKAISRDDTYNLKEGFSYDNSQRLAAYFEEASSFTKAIDYAQWLSNKGAYIIYLLSAPIYTPITDKALIDALDELENLVLHKGHSRITVTSVNGVKAYLDLTYYKSTQKELETEVARLNEEISRLKANQPKGTASGTEIVVEDSAEMESILKISGNSEQDSRSGKNLLQQDLFTTAKTVNGITFTPNADGSIKIKGTATARADLHLTTKLIEKLTVGKTYTSSIGQEMTSNLRMVVEEVKGSSWVANISYASKTTWTYNGLTSGDAYRVLLAIDSGSVLDTTIYPMIEEGTVATSYEPYGAMPSPDYPAEIRSVKSKSDNLLLFPYADGATKTISGVTFTSNNDGSVTINGTATSNAAYYISYVSTGKMKLKGKFIMSCEKTLDGDDIFRGLYNSSDGTTKYIGTDIVYNFTEETSVGLYLVILSGKTVSNLTVRPMLNKGDKALPYQPYGYVPVEAKVEGKNLFDEASLLGNYLTDGYYSFSDSALKDIINPKIKAIKGFKTATQYTISLTGYFTTGTWIKFTFYYTDGTSKSKAFNENKEADYVFTSDAGKTIDYIELARTYWADGKVVFIKENTLQLEEGSTATPYEPYKLTTVEIPLGDIELRSTPDGTRDTFERVDGVWNYRGDIYSERALPESVTSYRAIDFNPNFIAFYFETTKGHTAGGDNIKNAVSNRFVVKGSSVFNVTNNAIWLPGRDRTVYISIEKSKLADISTTDNAIASFKTWLEENPLYIDYVLATPTYTPITDAALIQALDELEQLILHKGYNRITVTSVNGVKAYLDLSYTKDINTVLNNIITKLGGL